MEVSKPKSHQLVLSERNSKHDLRVRALNPLQGYKSQSILSRFLKVSATRPVGYALFGLSFLALNSCENTNAAVGGNLSPGTLGTAKLVVISVKDQKMTVVREGAGRVSYPISTSKFGLGDRSHSWETPTGKMEIAAKIGGGAPPGSVFHGRMRTGEIVRVNAPGRDAIVTRILALRGLESRNADAMSRGIYIHGTPEERKIGVPSSYGCIRMKSRDVIDLYNMVTVGTRVYILDSKQRDAIAAANTTTPIISEGTRNALVAANSGLKEGSERSRSTAKTRRRIRHFRGSKG